MDAKSSRWVGKEAGGDGPADPEGQPGGMRRAGRFIFKTTLIFGGLFLLFLLGMMLMTSLSLEGMTSFRDWLERADSVLVFFRVGLIGLLITFWHPLNTWFAQHNGWSKVRLQRVLAGRWWSLGLLLFVELILVQRLHESLFGPLANYVLGMVN